MAGVDTPSNGEAILAPGASVGLLTQEPELDPAKDVRANVEEGVAPTRALLARFEEISQRLGDDMTPEQMEALLEEYQEVQDAIERANAWDLDRHLEVAMDALRVPAGRRRRDAPSPAASAAAWRCAGCCSSSPDLLLLDEPTNHLDAESVAWLERFLSEYQGTVVAVTHDRYFLDNVAGWILELDRGARHPLARQLLLVAGAEGAAARRGGEAGVGPPAHAGPRARVGAHEPEGASGQEQGPRGQLPAAGGRGGPARGGHGRDPHPGRPAPGRRRGRGRAACARASATAC